MPFNLESFAGNPKEELSTLRYATKQDLRDLAAKCNIVVDPAYVKARLLSNILDYLINEEIIADDEVQALRIAAGVLPPVPVDTEVEKIRLQLQLEKVKKETTERELYLEEKRTEAREKERKETTKQELYLEEKRAEAREKEREAEIRHQIKLQELSSGILYLLQERGPHY
ncbi:plectin-like [Palaemon carinicauda]|uniref:plectin-like n=1 Tax=Palaemon carinicauda TaxID=392227 RepID=UPI0035B5C65C